MKDNHLISVIIPAYNRKSFIEEAIRSVKSQNYKNLEVLVVDDGSTDGTYEILKKYHAEGSIRLFHHPGRLNRGQSRSINLGLEKAKGEYVAILDSDDMFAPNKLVEQAAILIMNPDIGMVYGQGHAIDASGNFLFEIPGHSHEETGDPNRLLLDCYMALPGGSLIRKSVFDDVGYFEESFRAGQDHDMALRIMEKTKTVYLPKLAFYYRKHGDSISVKGLKTRWITGMRILERAQSRYPYSNATIRKRKAVLHFRLAQTFWRDGNKLLAFRHIITSGFLDPRRAISVILGRENI